MMAGFHSTNMASFRMVASLGIASGNLVPGLLYNIIFTLLEPYVKMFSISDMIKTILLLIGSIIGFLLRPLLGVFSDGLMFKYGRRRIFIVVGTFFVVISLLLMMYCYEIGELLDKKEPLKYGKILFITSIILSFTAANIVQSPARVLCSDVTPPSQQNLMSNICQACSGVSPIVSNLFGALEVYKLYR